jgi:predicted nucleic acid-binding Zn ribbon protein
MPRSNDGRWTSECKLCGKTFQQLRKDQEFCSQKCSNKAFPGVGGRKPARGVPRRLCKVCGTEFQPYRITGETCSVTCYRTTPEYREAQQRTNARPERQARKNELRRTSPLQSATVRAYNRKAQLAKYGVTVEDYERMLSAQGGVCILCGSAPKPDGIRAASKLHVDHDHESGAVRDLLCVTCNQGLGCFRDDPGLLRSAAEYIERHRSLA